MHYKLKRSIFPHTLDLRYFLGVKILNFTFLGVWNCSTNLFGYVNLCGYFLGGMSDFLGISFQNIAFCKIFCDVFMKKNVAFLLFFASKLLVSIKVLYKLNIATQADFLFSTCIINSKQ